MKKCHICQKDFEKLARAHLIPDSFKKISGEFGKTDDHLIRAGIYDAKAPKVQTLDFDKEILCPDCDNGLSNYDEALKVFVETWAGSSCRALSASGQAHVVRFSTDTDMLLAGLAVTLFRCSISSRCTSVDIGTKSENEMAKLLDERAKPPIPSSFSLKIGGVAPDPEKLEMILIDPFRIKKENCYIHVLIAYGTIFIAKFGQQPWPTSFDALPSIASGEQAVNIAVTSLDKSPISDFLKVTAATHRKKTV